MEILGLIHVPWWFLVLLCIALIPHVHKLYYHGLWWRLGIPGPKPALFFGEFKRYLQEGFPQYDAELVRKYGKVFGYYNGGHAVLMVSDPEMLKQITIKEFSTFSNLYQPFPSSKLFKNSLVGANDNHWKFLRSTLSPAFTTGKMKRMSPLLQMCTDNLIKAVKRKAKENDSIEIKDICGAFTTDAIATTGFGIDVDSQNNPNDVFTNQLKQIFKSSFNRYIMVLSIVFPFTKSILSFKGLEKIDSRTKKIISLFKPVVDKAIEERGKEQQNDKCDFLQLALNAHNERSSESYFINTTDLASYKNRGLTYDELMSNAILFLIAGFETTANALSFAINCLATHPSCQQRLIDEIDAAVGKEKPNYEDISKLSYLDMFVSEVLRLYPVGTRLDREAGRDITIQGHFIPKGVQVVFPIFVMHRDPKHWPEPEKFDPERFTPEVKSTRHPYAYLPFGHGPHNCIGMRLALMEMKYALVALLQNFRFLRAPETEDPPVLDTTFFLRAKNGIYVKVEER